MLCGALMGRGAVLHRWKDGWTGLQIHSGERQAATVTPALKP